MSNRAHNVMIDRLECRHANGHIPLWECEFHAWDVVSGRHVVLGHEFEKISGTEQERALYENAEILLGVCEKMRYSALTLPSKYWEQSPGLLAYYVLPDDACFRQCEVVRELAGNDLVLVANTGGIMAANYSIEFCEQLIESPELIDEYAKRIFTKGLETARRYRDSGADVAMTASDLADNYGPFFSPEQMKRFILPYIDEWAGSVKMMGMHSILHTDGNIMRYLDQIADTRLDALQALDPTAGMDLAQAKQLVGDRLCLCGNVDCGLLLTGTPEQIFSATKDILDSCAESGFVLGASNAVQPEVPMRNYQAMIDAWAQFNGICLPRETAVIH